MRLISVAVVVGVGVVTFWCWRWQQANPLKYTILPPKRPGNTKQTGAKLSSQLNYVTTPQKIFVWVNGDLSKPMSKLEHIKFKPVCRECSKLTPVSWKECRHMNKMNAEKTAKEQSERKAITTEEEQSGDERHIVYQKRLMKNEREKREYMSSMRQKIYSMSGKEHGDYEKKRNDYMLYSYILLIGEFVRLKKTYEPEDDEWVSQL